MGGAHGSFLHCRLLGEGLLFGGALRGVVEESNRSRPGVAGGGKLVFAQ
jgi:hypothetical protein